MQWTSWEGFLGGTVSRMYKEFPQIIKKTSSQLGKRFHTEGNTNGPYICEKMFIFIGNQGYEKSPTSLTKNH